MNYDELSKHVSEYEYLECKPVDEGYKLKNDHSKTVIAITDHALESSNWLDIFKQSWDGKHVEHMTRVTGYFSKVSGWNAGKLAELKDRNHTTL